MSQDGPLLALHGVSFAYGSTPVLHDLSGEGAGRVLAVLGENGAGKTTLLRLLCSQSVPGSGWLEVAGWDSRNRRGVRDYRARLGVVPQRLDLASSFTCEDVLRYACWLKRVPTARSRDVVATSLARFNLSDRARSKVSTLSGGMRQRLVLAQAVVNDPDVVVLDEPTVGLDPKQRVELRGYLAEMSQSCLVVLATHLVEDVAALADHVLMLEDGRVGHWGDLRSFCESAGVAVAEGATGAGPSGTELEAAFLRRAADRGVDS